VEAVELDDPPQPPIETQAVFLLRDAVAPQSMVAGLMMENGYVSVDSSGKTGIPGLFACGDCTGPPLQIAKATGDGLVAGQEAAKYIYELS
jgi:thioredoxin reductase (NADPH)